MSAAHKPTALARIRAIQVFTPHLPLPIQLTLSPINPRILFAALALAVCAAAQSKLQLKVHTGHGANGYDVNSTMISGEKDMLVIDPQFTLSEAHRLAAEILESKKNLALIYVTHPHPD